MQRVKYVIFDRAVFNGISSFVQSRGFHREQGGLLLGQRKKEALHITDCTFPGRLDGRSRFRFVRRDPKHQTIAYRKWLSTSKTTDWIGEWHTHPEKYPVPSITDRSTWQNQCNNRMDAMTYLIIGMSENWLGLHDFSNNWAKEVISHGQTEMKFLYA